MRATVSLEKCVLPMIKDGIMCCMPMELRLLSGLQTNIKVVTKEGMNVRRLKIFLEW